MPRERRRYVASPTRQRRVSSNDPQTLFLIDSQQPSHLGTPPPSPRRKRSPRSRSGWSRTSRRNTSRIARASSTSPRCAPRSHRSPAQLYPIADGLRSSSPYTSENERSAVCNRTTHAPPTDPHTDPHKITHHPRTDRMRRPRVRPDRHRGTNHLRRQGRRRGWHRFCIPVHRRRVDQRGAGRAHAPG